NRREFSPTLAPRAAALDRAEHTNILQIRRAPSALLDEQQVVEAEIGRGLRSERAERAPAPRPAEAEPFEAREHVDAHRRPPEDQHRARARELLDRDFGRFG